MSLEADIHKAAKRYMTKRQQVCFMDEVRQVLQQNNTSMRLALERIAKWHGEFPDTGKTGEDGSPISYGAWWGSNGERDYMRNVAHAALTEKPDDCRRALEFFDSLGVKYDQDTPPTDYKSVTISVGWARISFEFTPDGGFRRLNAG